MKSTTRRLVFTWIIGAAAGTAMIAVTSPLFVRSYLPLHADPLRGVWTLAPGHTYRWRSEGYADTQIGPLGMPGKTTVEPGDSNAIRVALWGDSQAEGVCVDDEEKLFAQIEEASYGLVEAYPLSRSGEDAAAWVTQMPAVDRHLDIDLHVILLVDLPDLLGATRAPLPPPSDADLAGAQNAIAARLPAFVIQAARHLLTESDGATHRRLRFTLGPVAEATPTDSQSQQSDSRLDWSAALETLRGATSQPIILLYAPKVPQIVGGAVLTEDADADRFAAMAAAADRLGISVIDVRDNLRESAIGGDWPHGFHNGQIGAGHLNARGYRRIANELVQRIEKDFSERGN